MEWIGDKDRILEHLKKYRYVLLILLLGLFLMCLPQPNEEEEQTEQPQIETDPDLQESLAAILSQISGAGKVEVLLTQAAGEQTIYQTDVDISDSDQRRETVLVTNTDRNEVGLIQQVNPPVYLGAIVVCQGADNAGIRLSIVEAVMSVTGLTSDHITVLKMK